MATVTVSMDNVIVLMGRVQVVVVLAGWVATARSLVRSVTMVMVVKKNADIV